MSRYRMGLIVITVLVVAAAATHSGLSSNMTADSAKSAVLEFSDEQRGRIFDVVMGISDAPVTEVTAPEVAELFAGGGANAGSAKRHHPRDSVGWRP